MTKTAMQELRWFVSDGLDNFDESIKVSEIWEKINALLEMEKQQIIEAYGVKVNHSIEQGTTVYTRTFGEQYYNEKFKK